MTAILLFLAVSVGLGMWSHRSGKEVSSVILFGMSALLTLGMSSLRLLI